MDEKIVRIKRREKRFTTTKILVYTIGLICALLLTLLTYAVIKFINVINGEVLTGVATSNPYFVAYATLITQLVLAFSASLTLMGYVFKYYTNKSSLEFIFNSDRYQIDYMLKLQERNSTLNIFPEKELKAALEKTDSHIEQVKTARINKVLNEDISSKIT